MRSWVGVYKVAGAAALLTAVFIPIQVGVFLASPPPLQGTAAEWFALLQRHRLIGLIDLDLLLVADNVLFIPIFLALFVALRETGPSASVLAGALGFLAAALFIATNPAVEMLNLSTRYAAATTEAERTVALAAGQGLLAVWQGTAFHVAYIAGSLAGMTMSAVMLQSPAFSRWTAYLGILGNLISLGLYVPVVGIYVSVFSVLFLWLWYLLLIREFFALATRAAPS